MAKGSHSTLQTAASIALCALFLFGLYLLFSPFFLALVSGGMIALVCRPMDEWMQTKIKNRSGSAFASLIVFMLCVITPLAVLVIFSANEAKNLASTLSTQDFSLSNATSSARNLIEHIGLTRFIPNISEGATKLASTIGGNGLVILGGFAGALGSGLLSLITAYYCMTSYEAVREGLVRFSPFSRKDDEHLLRRIREAVHGTVVGNLSLTAIQIVTSSIGFFLFGISSPILFGFAYGIGSLIPIVGSAVVWVPIVLFEIIVGNYPAAIGVTAWSLAQIIFLERLLGPKLIGRGAQLHPLLVLVGILGGVYQFGPVGIFLGPTLVAVGTVGLELLYRSWSVPQDRQD